MIYPFLIFISLFPVILIGFIVYRVDREKESLKSMITFYALGLFSAFVASVLENLFFLKETNLFNIFINCFIFIALFEEVSKFACFKIGTKMVRSYDNFFDSVIFCTAVSLGFAAIENILYVFRSAAIPAGVTVENEFIYLLTNGFSTGLLRAFLAVPGHAIFSIYMGYFIDKNKEYKFYGSGGEKAYLVLAILVPVVLHGFYDFFCLSISEGELYLKNPNAPFMLFIVFVVYIIFLYISGIFILYKGAKKSDLRFDGSTNRGGKGPEINCFFCGKPLHFTVCPKCGGDNTKFIEAINKYYKTYGTYPKVPSGPFKVCPKCGNFSEGYFCNKCGNVL